MHKKIAALGLLLVFLLLPAAGLASLDYRLGPEDEIEIKVWSHDDLTRKVRVGLDGSISFPFVGEIKAQGLSVLDLQRELEQRLGPRYLIDPHVSITVTEYKSQKFFVVGNVNKPGTYPLTRPIHVVEAISLAGGLETTAGRQGHRQHHGHHRQGQAGGEKGPAPSPRPDPGRGQDRGVPRRRHGGGLQQNLEIKNGDTIYIPSLYYYVQGQVKNCGRYPYEENMTVLMAITTAGGFHGQGLLPARLYRPGKRGPETGCQG